jgi:hypothetical protein
MKLKIKLKKQMDIYGIGSGKDIVLYDGIFYIFDGLENTKIGNEVLQIEGGTKIVVKDSKIQSMEKFEKNKVSESFWEISPLPKFFIDTLYSAAIGSSLMAASARTKD